MPCLTPEQIEQLVHTSAEDPGTAPSQRHAEQCERCRRSIEEAILNEQMLRLLRHYPDEPPAQAEAHMPAADLIEGFEILREIGRGGKAVG